MIKNGRPAARPWPAVLLTDAVALITVWLFYPSFLVTQLWIAPAGGVVGVLALANLKSVFRRWLAILFADLVGLIAVWSFFPLSPAALPVILPAALLVTWLALGGMVAAWLDCREKSGIPEVRSL